jgi:hypothetical protein
MIGRSDDSNSTEWLDDWIRKRLAAMIDSAGLSYDQIATATNQPYSSIKRLIGGEAQTIDASLACAIAIACDRAPHELFDRGVTFRQGRTGVASIDKMLVNVYNDTSDTGICTLQSWVTDDYRLLCSAYDEPTVSEEIAPVLVDVDPIVAPDLDNLHQSPKKPRKGMTLKDEVKLNEQAARDTGTRKSLTLVDVDVIDDELLWVQYNIDELYAGGRDTHIRRQIVDLVTLEHTISRYRSNGRLKPRIRRRLWKELREGANDVSHFATDFEGYGRPI